MPRPPRIPRHVWVAASLVSVLHALPFVRTRLAAWGDGPFWPLPVGHLPKDSLMYVGLIREASLADQVFLANPFTTEPHSGRMIMLLLQALNGLARGLGINPFWLFELSRVPLLFLFTWALWRFLARLFDSDRERGLALWLVLFSGGVEYLARAAAPLLPPQTAFHLSRDLWPVYGWSTFSALYNPLWVAGFVLLLLVLPPLLQPGGPHGARQIAGTAVGLAALWFTHPYSCIAAAAVVVAAVVLEALLQGAPAPSRLGRLALATLPPLALAAAVSLWQRQDPIFRHSAGQVLGEQGAPAFWYPLTLAAVGAFAVRGGARWAREQHPWRFALAGWALGIALLHSSTVLNGYHFVPYLHLPVAVCAVPALAPLLERLLAPPRRVLPLAGLGVLLLGATPNFVLEHVEDAEGYKVPTPLARLLQDLGREPPGNVLTIAGIGNLVPAFGPHRVYVGHWFLTPDFAQRSARAERLLGDPVQHRAALLAHVAQDRLSYLIAPSAAGAGLREVLGPQARFDAYGDYLLVRLRAPGS